MASQTQNSQLTNVVPRYLLITWKPLNNDNGNNENGHVHKMT